MPLQPAGTLKIEVTFDIAGDRNLSVTVTEVSTDRHIKARITSDWLSKVNYDDIAAKKGEISSQQEAGEDVPMANEEIIEVAYSTIKIWGGGHPAKQTKTASQEGAAVQQEGQL